MAKKNTITIDRYTDVIIWLAEQRVEWQKRAERNPISTTAALSSAAMVKEWLEVVENRFLDRQDFHRVVAFTIESDRISRLNAKEELAKYENAISSLCRGEKQPALMLCQSELAHLLVERRVFSRAPSASIRESAKDIGEQAKKMRLFVTLLRR